VSHFLPCGHWRKMLKGADIKVGHCPSYDRPIRSCQRYVAGYDCLFHRDCLVPVTYPAAS
jgi:hypothetical protein